MVTDDGQGGLGRDLDTTTSNMALSDIISNAMAHENSSKGVKEKNDLNVSVHWNICRFQPSLTTCYSAELLSVSSAERERREQRIGEHVEPRVNE